MIRLRRLPIRLRLVVGFATAMALLLTLTAVFVFWRVRISLDHRLDQDLSTQASDLNAAARRMPPAAALRSLRDEAREAQLFGLDGAILASGPGIPSGERLLTRAQVRTALQHPVQTHRGDLLTRHGALRIVAAPVHGQRDTVVAAMAVRLDQRDEALRELLAQLAIGNALALVLASLVGYRFGHAALDPVERYRRQAEAITHGASGLRLEVPTEPHDELARLGETLNGMIAALERSAERERHFIDAASHELRTPLTTLAAEISVALRRPRSRTEYEAALHRLQGTTRQLLELSETLLSLGALETARAAQDVVAVDDLLAATVRRARSELTNGRVARTADRSHLSVRGDRALLERALGNLADNAARHGAGDIVVSGQEAAAGQYVALAVHDEGVIDPRFLAHAAERFRRHEHARAGTGTGLGLALVDAIAVAHAGQLRICSEGRHHTRPASDTVLDELTCMHPTGGTTVTLLIPAGS